MENVKKKFDIEQMSEEELKEFKHWLFKENIRISSEQKEMKRAKEQLERETQLFEKKLQILQEGFHNLEADRKRFEKEKQRFYVEREYYEEDGGYFGGGMPSVQQLFCGVTNQLTLKKRYKDLIKIYHPDNLAGNHEMVVLINKEYDRLKSQFERQWKVT